MPDWRLQAMGETMMAADIDNHVAGHGRHSRHGHHGHRDHHGRGHHHCHESRAELRAEHDELEREQRMHQARAASI